MAQQDARTIQAALAMPFAPEDLEWRLQKVIENRQLGIAVPYVTNRAIQNRLDDVVGPDNWYNDYKPWHGTGKKESQICGISIYFETRGWITKWDGAEDSDIEPIKGGLSDSMKRAAVQWGIGRVLYNMDAVFVDIEQRGKTWYIAKKEQSKLDKAYLDTLAKLGLTPAKAGGVRPALAPDSEPGTPAPPQASAPRGGTPVSKPTVLPKPDQAQPRSSAAAPKNEPSVAYEYKVTNARVQGGMSGSNTQLMLEGPNGKRINAFARGTHPDLTPGTLITGAKLTMRKQDTVVFYILEDYRIATFQRVA